MLREYENSILFVNKCLYIHKYIYIYIHTYIYIFIYNLFSFINIFINFIYKFSYITFHSHHGFFLSFSLLVVWKCSLKFLWSNIDFPDSRPCWLWNSWQDNCLIMPRRVILPCVTLAYRNQCLFEVNFSNSARRHWRHALFFLISINLVLIWCYSHHCLH